MIYLISVVIFLISCFFMVKDRYKAKDFIVGTHIFFSIVIIITSICILMNLVTADSRGAEMLEIQTAIDYKLRYEEERDDTSLYSKEIIDEIESWNRTIVKREKLEKNIWVGIFYPNLIDRYDLHRIEYKWNRYHE